MSPLSCFERLRVRVGAEAQDSIQTSGPSLRDRFMVNLSTFGVAVHSTDGLIWYLMTRSPDLAGASNLMEV